ncbi:hypothetical protein V8F20_012030 [Naviculisporaceae sp. PSN 640]
MSLFLQQRDNAQLPDECYDPCNNAYIEAQIVGKTRELCVSGSKFSSSYLACTNCIKNNIAGNANEVISEILDPSFSQYIDYCEGDSYDKETATLLPPPPPTRVIATATSFLAQPGGAGVSTETPTVNEGATIITTIWGTTTLSDGLVVSLPVTATIVGLDRGLFGGGPESYTSPTGSSRSGLSEEAPASSSRPSTGTIVGAVIGGVSGLMAIIVLVLFFFRRRTKEKHQDHHNTGQGFWEENDKAQLHGDSMVEMGTESNTVEVEGDAHKVLSRCDELEAKQVYELATPPAELYGSEVTTGLKPGDVQNQLNEERGWRKEES